MFKTIPDLNNNAPLWRRSLKLSHWICSCSTNTSYSYLATASSFDAGLSQRGELLPKSLRIRHFDFSDCINKRFGLGM